MKKPVASVVSIDAGRRSTQGPERPTPSAAMRKRVAVFNQHSARQFAAKFYGMGKSSQTAMRETGLSLAEADQVFRAFGTRDWERRALGVAA
jgi:hypothetical protein